MQAMQLITDSGTARTISADGEAKIFSSSVRRRRESVINMQAPLSALNDGA
jgi:hypothetical protein